MPTLPWILLGIYLIIGAICFGHMLRCTIENYLSKPLSRRRLSIWEDILYLIMVWILWPVIWVGDAVDLAETLYHKSRAQKGKLT